MTNNDFLNTDFGTADTPKLPPPTLPFFQFHSDAEVFEFPLTLTEKRGGQTVESPLWSAILRDSKLKPQKLSHNGRKTQAYVFEQIHFCVLGEHIYWFDQKGKIPGRFQYRPNPAPDGSRFLSKRLLVGLVREVEEHAPGTLCYLTVSSMASKHLGATLRNFDKAILLPAHQARLAKIREANPDFPEPQTMLFPRWAFWMPLKAGEPVNVSTQDDIEKYIAPIVGDWNPDGESLERLRELFIPADLRQAIQSDYLPTVKRWTGWQESRLTAAAAASGNGSDDEPAFAVDEETGEILY